MVSRYGDGPLRHALGERLPSSSSMARYSVPSISPMSKTWQTLGWLTDGGALRASRQNRRRATCVEPVGADRLDRHPALQALVERLVDDAHAALAALAEDPVLRQPSGDGVVGHAGTITSRIRHYDKLRSLKAGGARLAQGMKCFQFGPSVWPPSCCRHARWPSSRPAFTAGIFSLV